MMNLVTRFRVKRVNFGGIGTYSGDEIDIEIGDGVTLVDGLVVGKVSLSSNGAGKSTLVTAIMLSMFGETGSGAIRGDGIISDRIRDGRISGEAFACSEIHDIVNGDIIYSEWRKALGKSATFSVSDGKSLIGNFTCGSEEHREYVAASFGVSPQAYSETAYYPQGYLSIVSDGTDLNRKKALIDILGLAGCEIYHEGTKNLVRDIDANISDNLHWIELNRSKIRELKVASGDLKEIESKIAELDSDLAGVLSSIRMVMSAIDRM